MRRITTLRTLLWLTLGCAAEPALGQFYVANYYLNSVAEYTMSGALLNPAIITDTAYGGLVDVTWDGADGLYIIDQGSVAGAGIIGKYTLSGAVVDAHFITGVNFPKNAVFDGQGHLFVSNSGDFSGAISEYTTSGQLVNPSLITGLGSIGYMALDGSGHLFVTRPGRNTISEYTTSGALVNDSLVTGLSFPLGIALDGKGNLFVVNSGTGTIGKYTTSGQTVNASLYAGLTSPRALACDGEHLFVGNGGTASPAQSAIVELTLSGQLLNPNFAPGVYGPMDIAIVPEPRALASGAIGLGLLLLRRLPRTAKRP